MAALYQTTPISLTNVNLTTFNGTIGNYNMVSTNIGNQYARSTTGAVYTSGYTYVVTGNLYGSSSFNIYLYDGSTLASNAVLIGPGSIEATITPTMTTSSSGQIRIAPTTANVNLNIVNLSVTLFQFRYTCQWCGLDNMVMPDYKGTVNQPTNCVYCNNDWTVPTTFSVFTELSKNTGRPMKGASVVLVGKST